MIKINRDQFFLHYRQQFGKIKYQQTVDNITCMLNTMENLQGLFSSVVLAEQLAYVAATVHHETGTTYGAMREKRASKWRQPGLYKLQNRYWLSGYYGRGPVQLTWRDNYRKFQEITGKPILDNPDLLLIDLQLGYEITIHGMTKGLFTGARLDRYISSEHIDFINARRVVNLLDKAKKIAGYAEKFKIIFINSIEPSL